MIPRSHHRARRILFAATAAAALSVAMPAAVLAQGHEPEEERRAAVRKGDPQDRFCISETGARVEASRIRGRGGDQDCTGAGGRVLTRAEIEGGSSADARDALRRLEASGR